MWYFGVDGRDGLDQLRTLAQDQLLVRAFDLLKRIEDKFCKLSWMDTP